jgi:hypothetical protein
VADGDVYDFLSGLSAHPDRPGDVSNFNPVFASRLAAALRQARAAGLPVSLMSGFREPGQTGSAYDAGGNSSHTYGLASDISGLDGPNGKITQQWAQIAEANGLHNPYGIGDKAEFNHWQLPATPLEQQPQLLASLKAAKATGNFQNVWSAYNAGGGPARPPSPVPAALGTTINTPGGPEHVAFIRNYAQQIGLNPDLALGIANAEGLRAWSASNPNAASYVDRSGGEPFSFGDFQLNIHPGALGAKALAAGVDPRDPAQWQAADRFAMDQMKAGGVGPWKGDPVGAAYLARGVTPDVSGILAQAQNTPVSPRPSGAMTPGQGGIGSDYAANARNAPTALAGGAGAPGAGSGILPGFGTADASNAFLKGASGLDKALGGKGLPGQSGGGEAGGGQDRPSPMIPAPPAIGVSPLLSQAPMAYGQTLNSLREPMQWGSSPPGSPPFPNAGAAVAPTMPMGTSLAALQQLQMLSNPQMFGMMGQGGDPYGGYGYG